MRKRNLISTQNGSSLVMRRSGRRSTVVLAALLSPLAVGAAQAPTATELMDWAQAKLASEFPGSLSDVVGAGFVFRGPYSTGNYVGVEGSTVYVLGPVTGGQLLAVGTLSDLACTVKPASCQPSDALMLVDAYLARVDGVYAAELTGTTARPLLDGCYLNSGLTAEAEMARLDGDPSVRASVNRKRGSTRRDAEVLAERFMVNLDGSDRREIDVRYKLIYADGELRTQDETLIQGSSAGTQMPQGVCATPQVSSQLRTRGNQRIVGTSVSAINFLVDRYKLTDGTAQATSSRQYRNEIRFNITDPGNNATYATISGPGIVGAAYKMVSPRLLRAAPEFAGKIGNFVDWADDETFKACRKSLTDGNYADAAVADCATNGAASNNWRALGTDPVAVDNAFASYGFQENGVYTVKVYNDDGWKTVNGQAGKTPIATYNTSLNRPPASAVALAAGSLSVYGSGSLSLTPAQLAALIRNKSSSSLKADETVKAKIDNETLQFTALYFFGQGRTAVSTGSNFYPASRYNPVMSPSVGAASVTLDVPTGPTAMTVPNYGEVGMIWDDLRGLSVRRLVVFE